MRATWMLGCSAVLALAAIPAFAQPVVSAKSGTISVADGKVLLDEKPLEIQPGQFPDMKEKSVLRTQEGRAEILLPPGMFLRVGENASFRMISNRLVDTRLELLSGSGVVEIDSTSKDSEVTILCKSGSVTFTKGIYRFDSETARLKVFEGNANVDIDGRSLTVSTGKMIGLTGDTASVEHFDVKDTDSLDHWSRRRGEEVAMANVSAARRASTSSAWGNSYNSGYGSYNSAYSPLNPCMGMGMGMGMGAGMGMGPYGYGAYTPAAYALGAGTMMGGAWAYNPWYGMITYMPCSGMMFSPYGYGFWSPYAIGRLFYGGGSFFGRGSTGGFLGGGLTSRGIGTGLFGRATTGYVRGISPAMHSAATSNVGSAAASGGASRGGYGGGGFGGGHAGGGFSGGGAAGGHGGGAAGGHGGR